jgi:simple sugar transport system permease protein
MKKAPLFFEVLSTTINILIALLIGSVLLLLKGENPLQVFYYLLIEPFTMGRGWIKVLSKTAPYIFTGLSAALAFRCGIFNIGIEGQMFWGALAAAVAGISFAGLPKLIHLPLALLAAMAAGGIWAGIAGWLKVRLRVHEVLSTIMMNYLASNIVAYLLITYFRAAGPQAKTPNVFPGARLSRFFPPDQLNTGIIIALLIAAGVFVLLRCLPLGWKIDSVGKNMVAARYCGIDSGRTIMTVMVFSGMIAALCGAERVLGAFGYMDLGFSAGYGFDGLAVAVIAANNPAAVLLVSLFFGLLNYGGVTLSMMTRVPPEWVNTLVAIMLILVAARSSLFRTLQRWFRGRKGWIFPQRP